ncbi:MAG TPA: hypothetical protein VE954_31830 [Oligoflexus sp.]|uniref:hypothetical protein n=1 Tax=Oligoflexus sp. TaxID=1971216 RepID=UPI002D34692D|nr:hypothetical protein [Oligoflexus sp.]HYX37715.1 hypothetical protein [Oligoflexus sp.]
MSFSVLVKEWLDAHPSRNSARLSKLTSVSEAEISAILRGRHPSMDVAARLGSVLPVEPVLVLISTANPIHKKFLSRALSRENVAV